MYTALHPDDLLHQPSVSIVHTCTCIYHLFLINPRCALLDVLPCRPPCSRLTLAYAFAMPTEYRPVYSDHGQLGYIPDHLHDPESIRRRIFQTRGRRPHRIHIARVAPDPLLFRRQSTNKSYIYEKLAGPRDNAKRYLRSFIDSHFANPPSQAVVDTTTTTPRSSTSSASTRNTSPPESRRWSQAIGEMRSNPRNSVNSALSAVGGPRPSLVESHRSSARSSVKSMMSSSVKTLAEDKPLASGNGISVGVSLTEPLLFLQGFEQSDSSERSTAMLRGTLNLKVTKVSKIKAITLKFRGKAITKWPEGTFPQYASEHDSDCRRNSSQKNRI